MIVQDCSKLIGKASLTYISFPLEGGMFADTKRARTMINAVDTSRCTIMHHRKQAATGSVNFENSHPFEHSDTERYLVGVHNGSLTGTPSKYDGIDFDVDSDYALYRIFKDGIEAFKDIQGSYAFVWYENDGNLRIACNGERELSIAFVHKKNSMLIASEPSMLYWLAERNNIKIDDILQPDKFKLLTFDLEGDLRDFTDDAISKPVYRTTSHVQGGWHQSNKSLVTTDLGSTDLWDWQQERKRLL